MNLIVAFESAELQFKQILEEFFISVYNEKSLTSHGIEHHRRVWNYAKELSLLLYNSHKIQYPVSISGLIIACYLHDIGMSVDAGVRHGHHSKELCLHFLSENSLDKADYNDVLLAIENHDNKDYKTSTAANDLLTILAVADDLDAFGHIGIYRYSEIYLTRGVDPKEIGYMIKENATKRYYNFANIFEFDEKFVSRHKERYKILENFFGEYNIQAATYKFGGNEPIGYCGVIDVFTEMLQCKVSLNYILSNLKTNLNDPVIQHFTERLLSEFET